MIASLRGRVIFRQTNRVVIEAQGVGYDVTVPITVLESIQGSGEVFLHICTVLRENSLELYGFGSPEEKALFELLLTVSGIGPRTSIVILSGSSPEQFRRAVLDGDVRGLTAIPGIGKKSAERIILELKEKLGKHAFGPLTATGAPQTTSVKEDLISSLMNLGYKEKVAVETARKVLKDAPVDISAAHAVKLALKELMNPM